MKNITIQPLKIAGRHKKAAMSKRPRVVKGRLPNPMKMDKPARV